MLKTQGLGLKIGSTVILQDIDLEISAGECLGLAGPNGSGKTSLLKLLALLENRSTGNIWIQGQEIIGNAPLSVRRRLAIVFQEALLFNSSVVDNVAAGLKIRRLPHLEIKDRVEKWLDAFGVLHLKKRHARSLSGGEAQRVSLARAFALEPDILYLDEPFSSLDAPIKESLLADLSKVFQSTDITSIIVSHDFRDIDRLASRSVILVNGRITADGTPKDLISGSLDNATQAFLAPWQNIYKAL